ncbi:MAG TPA: ribosome biogenesis factor YjgA [Burkholderiales bacterium]|nr:ribosome biogenesis factor YjgA [Burkholderiales bacterium]
MDQDPDASKSQRKRDMHALQALGKMLVELPQERLAKMELPESLRDAVLDAKRISAHGALRRQLQYVGRLMRDVDADRIREQVDEIQAGSARNVAILHRAERWRTQLLDDADAMSLFVSTFPGADPQRLRTLVRNAKREKADSKPPRSFRQLLRDIRETMLKHERPDQSDV